MKNKVNTEFDYFLLFRVSLGILLIYKVGSLYPHWLDFFGVDGFFTREINEVTNDPLIPYWALADWISNAFSISVNQSSMVLMFTILLFAVFLLAGFMTRFSSVCLLLLNISLTGSFSDYIYGVDFFLSTLLFYSIFVPIGYKQSIDGLLNISWLNKANQWRLRASEARLMMGAHLCIVYLTGGVTKAFGPTWWNGGAIWTALNRPGLDMSLSLVEIFDYKIIYVLLGVSTIFVELLYPIAIWFKKTRKIWLLLTLGMHLFIGMVLELYFFATVMMLFNVVAFGGEMKNDFSEVMGSLKSEKPSLAKQTLK
ncbi:hypothetical protein CEQ90_12065 [Lewinellaceae bacterium SD302]|nr:hypothetical protein CEQ90_12065 [Lewinellaceae bacterium SD302]